MIESASSIIIESATDIPEEWARSVVQASGWPSGVPLLLLLGSAPLKQECGRTVWHGHKAQSVGLEGLWTFGHWRCAVIVTECATRLFDRYPSFVAWILGHEMGHALLALHEPDTHALSIFVQTYIRCASAGAITEWFDLPHEDIFDRFGRFVAASVVGPDRFAQEIRKLAAEGNPPIASARLLRMLDAAPLPTIPPVLSALRAFVAPYSRQLRQFWVNDARRGDESYVKHLDPSMLLVD